MPALNNSHIESYVNAAVSSLAGRLQECIAALEASETIADYAAALQSIKQACDATWQATLPYHHTLK